MRKKRTRRNPIVRGDKLPSHLQQQVLARYIYRWTTGNSQREYVYRNIEKPRIPLISDAQWLREHAFHVTKAGKLDARKKHAEPHYVADDWKQGENPRRKYHGRKHVKRKYVRKNRARRAYKRRKR